MMKLVTSGVLAAVLLSGCTQNDPVINFSEEANQAALTQTATAPPTSSPSPTQTWTADEAAAIGVTQRMFQECMPAADQNPSEARKFLRECATGEQLESLAAAVGRDMDEGHKYEGNYTFEPYGVDPIRDDFIEVQGCLDGSSLKKTKADDGSVIFDGLEKTSKRVGVIKQDNAWLVWGTQPVDDKDYCSGS